MPKRSSGKRGVLSRIIRGRPKPSLSRRSGHKVKMEGVHYAENRAAARRIQADLRRKGRKASIKANVDDGYSVYYSEQRKGIKRSGYPREEGMRDKK